MSKKHSENSRKPIVTYFYLNPLSHRITPPCALSLRGGRVGSLAKGRSCRVVISSPRARGTPNKGSMTYYTQGCRTPLVRKSLSQSRRVAHLFSPSHARTHILPSSSGRAHVHITRPAGSRDRGKGGMTAAG